MKSSFLSDLAALRGTPWYRWHPNIALRYLPVVERVKKLKVKNEKLKVLEVGSGSLGIAPYLKGPVTGLDREFEPPFHPLLNRVVGDGTKLKFANASFDAVISVDMLEHLAKDKRQAAIYEMMRVARGWVILGVPCGKFAQKHDRKIRDDYIKRRKAGYKFANEHIKLGLPEEIDILRYIKAAARDLRKEIEIEIEGNMNLRLRSFLMLGWMSKNIFVNILFRKVFLLLIPVFRWLDRPPYYRKIFFVVIRKNG